MQALSQDPNFTAAAGDYVGGMKADLEEEIKAQADAMAEDSTGVDTTLGDDDDAIYVLDEIGRMELKSEAFATRVEALLARGVRLVGAITAPIYGHRVAFCDRVSATRGVAVHKLTKSTRDGVTAELRESLVARFVKPKPSGKRKRK